MEKSSRCACDRRVIRLLRTRPGVRGEAVNWPSSRKVNFKTRQNRELFTCSGASHPREFIYDFISSHLILSFRRGLPTLWKRCNRLSRSVYISSVVPLFKNLDQRRDHVPSTDTSSFFVQSSLSNTLHIMQNWIVIHFNYHRLICQSSFARLAGKKVG